MNKNRILGFTLLLALFAMLLSPVNKVLVDSALAAEEPASDDTEEKKKEGKEEEPDC